MESYTNYRYKEALPFNHPDTGLLPITKVFFDFCNSCDIHYVYRFVSSTF